jgi:hypothetical protein
MALSDREVVVQAGFAGHTAGREMDVDVLTGDETAGSELPEHRRHVAPRLAPPTILDRLVVVPWTVVRLHVEVHGVPGHVGTVLGEVAARVSAVPEAPTRVEDDGVLAYAQSSDDMNDLRVALLGLSQGYLSL